MDHASPTRNSTNELTVRDTHAIGSWPSNRLLAQSSGRGWHNVHAALATVNSWSGSLAPTGHPCVAYCLHRPARLRLRMRGGGRAESRTLQPRQFLLIPGHEETEWQRHGTSDMLMLYLRQDMIDAAAVADAGRTGGAVRIDFALGTIDPLMEQLALAILRVLQSPEDGSSALYVDSLAHTLVLHLLRAQGHGRDEADEADGLAPSPPTLRRVCDYIEAHLGSDLTVARLAAEADLAPRTFARAFSKVFGVPVHQYVVSRRLKQAEHLLVSTDLSVVDIALQTGFASQSHLSTAFRKTMGSTPGQYRIHGDKYRSLQRTRP